jgi:hypothetical protein
MVESALMQIAYMILKKLGLEETCITREENEAFDRAIWNNFRFAVVPHDDNVGFDAILCPAEYGQGQHLDTVWLKIIAILLVRLNDVSFTKSDIEACQKEFATGRRLLVRQHGPDGADVFITTDVQARDLLARQERDLPQTVGVIIQ